ncbi:MAG: alpha/beta hydrolase-fold protein [Flavobacteriaceae bacterium]|nr:alpha/beta hydrolase-fold protein [Flavobacteriaceae bacterium]
MKTFTTLLLTFSFGILVFGQDLSTYEKKVFTHNGQNMPYRLLLPKNFDASQTYPLILVLHGAGERGNDNEAQLVHGASLFLNETYREKYPAFVLFPQCPADDFWSNVSIKTDTSGQRVFDFQNGGKPTQAMEHLQALLKDFIKNNPVKENQIYVGGLSMGGMGTFEIVHRNPDLFAAAFPICGGANPDIASKVKNVDWWVFHGGDDDVVPVAYSQKMVSALNQQGARVKFSYYHGVNHNSWDHAFAEKDLLPWLFSHK